MKFNWQNHPEADLIEEELVEHPDQFQRDVIFSYLMWLRYGKDDMFTLTCTGNKKRPHGRFISLEPGKKASVSQDVYGDPEVSSMDLFEIEWEELEALVAASALEKMGVELSDEDPFELVPPPSSRRTTH